MHGPRAAAAPGSLGIGVLCGPMRGSLLGPTGASRPLAARVSPGGQAFAFNNPRGGRGGEGQILRKQKYASSIVAPGSTFMNTCAALARIVVR